MFRVSRRVRIHWDAAGTVGMRSDPLGCRKRLDVSICFEIVMIFLRFLDDFALDFTESVLHSAVCEPLEQCPSISLLDLAWSTGGVADVAILPAQKSK